MILIAAAYIVLKENMRSVYIPKVRENFRTTFNLKTRNLRKNGTISKETAAGRY